MIEWIMVSAVCLTTPVGTKCSPPMPIAMFQEKQECMDQLPVAHYAGTIYLQQKGIAGTVGVGCAKQEGQST